MYWNITRFCCTHFCLLASLFIYLSLSLCLSVCLCVCVCVWTYTFHVLRIVKAVNLFKYYSRYARFSTHSSTQNYSTAWYDDDDDDDNGDDIVEIVIIIIVITTATATTTNYSVFFKWCRGIAHTERTLNINMMLASLSAYDSGTRIAVCLFCPSDGHPELVVYYSFKIFHRPCSEAATKQRRECNQCQVRVYLLRQASDSLRQTETGFLLVHLQTFAYQRNRLHGVYYTSRNIQNSDKSAFTCTICSKTLFSWNGMDAHIRKQHLGVFRYNCEHCGRGFTSSSNFSKHACRATPKQGTSGRAWQGPVCLE